ncbi:MAG: 2-amino-4-hydroxy-6-hydroxymethyldihydropteridine diphosphokinase [Nevskiales bacterium]
MHRAESVLAAVGLGSNLDDPAAQLRRAFDEISKLSGTMVLARSPLYRSTAVGPDGQSVPQPDFCNAAVLLETRLSPRSLLDALQALEAAHGRDPQRRWVARSLDLDLLVYGDRVLNQPGMTVPHPRMAGRNFVLYPLRDIAPQLHIPNLGRVHELAAQLDSRGLQPWRD